MFYKSGKLIKSLIAVSTASLGLLYFYDISKLSDLPNFRTSSDVFKTRDSGPIPTREGLDDLHISGCSLPSQAGLEKHLSRVGMPVYNFDLQVEPHYFIKGAPERWYGYKRTDEVGVDMETVGLRHYIRRLLYTGKLYHTAEDARSEKEMTKDIGFNYIEICQIRHRVPVADRVDQFIEAINNIPQPAWINFHCQKGRGRTTIAIVMYDIMRNGKKVPLEDIVRRHYLLGSEDLFDTKVWAKSTYTEEMLKERKNFIEAFYKYVNDPEGYGVASWKDWSNRNNAYGTEIY